MKYIRLSQVKSMESQVITFLFFSLIFSVTTDSSTADDTLHASQAITDAGNQTIFSASGIFELGFFSPGGSNNRYVGIWYKKISNRTVVWVANREKPLKSTLGVLKLSNGNLEIMDDTSLKIWSSNLSKSTRTPVVAQLLDTGNLVVRYEDNNTTQNYLWQSFDFPCDNLLPGMKLGWDSEKGLDRYLSSWTSTDDPAPGKFTQRIDLGGYPQVLVYAGSDVIYRYGPWGGIQLRGVSFFKPNIAYELKLITSKQQTFAVFELHNNSTDAVRFVLQPDGKKDLLTYKEGRNGWTYPSYDPNVLWDKCDQYAFCGAYGSCNITEVKLGRETCGCLKGYVPKYADRWKAGNWSDGCVLRTKFGCSVGSDIFVKYSGLKLPDTRHSWYNVSMGLLECKEKCRMNCSCTAYSNIDVRQGGTGCLLWFNELIDLRDYNINGLDLFVRIAASESVGENPKSRRKGVSSGIIVVISVSVAGLVLVLTLLLILVLKNRKKGRNGRFTSNPIGDGRNEDEGEDLELPLFDFKVIADSAGNFSENNKLGEGGFGLVYKGILDDGQEIAVKRLSKTSSQGLHEFKNEVASIAKLQHRNLVRVLGCCIEEAEKLLIYEYMPNKSLDLFIFDKELSKKLDWPTRSKIINGIGKGLLYLHHDSRLRIIHRDLKAGNILLDEDMSPKISDFGLARTFGGNESAVNTARIVGTYGYMSPEYAINGQFSVKSDVYSFGVVVLEIVSGKRVREFYHLDTNLLSYAWELFEMRKFMDLVDESIVESCNPSQVLRAIHMGLLCVQPYPQDRPNMTFIVSMLGNEAELPQPKRPGFFTEKRTQDSEDSSYYMRDLAAVIPPISAAVVVYLSLVVVEVE